jgi:hypothetical protein
MEWNGMEWNGMEWNGMEWNGMEWKMITYGWVIGGAIQISVGVIITLSTNQVIVK